MEHIVATPSNIVEGSLVYNTKGEYYKVIKTDRISVKMIKIEMLKKKMSGEHTIRSLYVSYGKRGEFYRDLFTLKSIKTKRVRPMIYYYI